ncbi:hypothetical protein V2J09_005415 [Rumex salicifolius]
MQIAVKRLKVWSDRAEAEFSVEVEILGKVRHKNLLTLRGYCSEGQERLIVYDYMPKLSLLSHLHGHHSAEGLLDWTRRMNISIGSAEDFQAKVADFGFAKFIPDGATHVTTRVKGTLGYLAPEYAMLGKAKESIDVYSFGILLLELATGRRPLQKLYISTKNIAEWALPLAHDKKFSELADPKLHGKYVEEEMRRVIIVGVMCASKEPEKRPTMTEVVKLLKGEANEKLADLENEVFKLESVGDGDEMSKGEDLLDSVSEEKSSKSEVETVELGSSVMYDINSSSS